MKTNLYFVIDRCACVKPWFPQFSWLFRAVIALIRPVASSLCAPAKRQSPSDPVSRVLDPAAFAVLHRWIFVLPTFVVSQHLFRRLNCDSFARTVAGDASWLHTPFPGCSIVFYNYHHYNYFYLKSLNLDMEITIILEFLARLASCSPPSWSVFDWWLPVIWTTFCIPDVF